VRQMKISAGIFKTLAVVAVVATGVFLTSCSSPRIKYYDESVALSRYKESIMLVPPLSQDPLMYENCQELGKFYQMALSQYTQGQITNAGTIPSLKLSIQWENIIKNGNVNLKEVTTIARTLGCNSAVTVNVIDFKRYPPFRMVVDIIWVDCLSGNMIARMYDDIDMTDSETSYRFENYIGDGYARSVYEQFTPYKALSQTAALKPTVFFQFVADYSTRQIMDEVSDSSTSWRFWRIF